MKRGVILASRDSTRIACVYLLSVFVFLFFACVKVRKVREIINSKLK